MEIVFYVIFLIIGLALGVFAGRLSASSGAAVVNEKLENERSRAAQAEERAKTAENEAASLRSTLSSETERRSASEQTASRVPALENAIIEKNSETVRLQNAITDLKETKKELETKLEGERKAAEEKLAALEDAKEKLTAAFEALSDKALKCNNEAFLVLAKNEMLKFHESSKIDLEQRQANISEMIKPVANALEKFDLSVKQLEKERVGSYSTLMEQVKSLNDTQKLLEGETSRLVHALKSPGARGSWGEIQLKRVVELAGMQEHCDFEQQQSVTTEDGRLRPDMIVNLPGGKNIIVDAKAPFNSYHDAQNTTDDAVKTEKLREHARQVRLHMSDLGKKAYWDQFQPAPEFVVMFLPYESLFSAAVQHEPGIIEEGVRQGVIPASPTTLIALLKAVAYGWQQEVMTENALEISKLGSELYDRIRVLSEHWAKMGKSLESAVDSYNKSVGSLERNVLTSARRFKSMGIATKDEIQELPPIEKMTRQLSAPEFVEHEDSPEVI
jgi:DNA recombination protein RmuC